MKFKVDPDTETDLAIGDIICIAGRKMSTEITISEDICYKIYATFRRRYSEYHKHFKVTFYYKSLKTGIEYNLDFHSWQGWPPYNVFRVIQIS